MSALVPNEKRFIGAIIFGVTFVVILKSIPLLIAYFLPSFSIQYPLIVFFVAGVLAALVASWVVRKYNPTFFR